MHDLSRYALALLGNAGSSGAQFGLSLALVAMLTASGFGLFTFLMLLCQFVWAVAGALFSAPMAALARDAGQSPGGDPSQGHDTWAVLALLQCLFVVPVGLSAFAIAAVTGPGMHTPTVYALVAMLGCLRQFGRISQYSRGDQRGVVQSDALYCIAMAIGIGMLFLADHRHALVLAFTMQACAQALCLVPLLAQFAGWRQSRRHAHGPGSPGLLGRYRRVWTRYSGWSLLGVVSTEATFSAHNYIVTGMLGTAAFGSIAATGILTRPGNVALVALGEFERARLARVHAEGGDLASKRRVFFAASTVVWLASLAVTVIALAWFPDLLGRRGYDRADLVVSAWGWLAVLLVRCAYLPMSTEMQSLGAFKALAWPTVIAMPVSVLGSFFLIGHFRPAWTLAAIVVGQVVVGVLIWRSYHAVLKSVAPA